MELSRNIAVLSYLLQLVCSSNIAGNEANCSKSDANGKCFSHKTTTEVKTGKLATYPLIITEVISDDKCIPGGEPYVIETKFKYKTKKSWSLKLNGSAVTDLKGIVYENGLSALVKIDSNLYGGYGNTKVEIAISDASEEKIITKQICAQRVEEKFSVSVVLAATLDQHVKFYVTSKDRAPVGTFHVWFGDGYKGQIWDLQYPVDWTSNKYYRVGVYNYRWEVFNADNDKLKYAEGKGVVKILYPVLIGGFYEFSVFFQKYWPENNVQFSLTDLCKTSFPNEVIYRIHFGDGQISPWLPLQHLSCYRTAKLVSHRYEKPGCYYTFFEMKNLLGWCHFRGVVRIHQTINSLVLHVASVPPSRTVEKVVDGVNITYLSKTDPFAISAITTGGRCSDFEYKILLPHWYYKGRDVGRVVINHLVGKPGTYELEVKVSNRMNSRTGKKKFILTTSLTGLFLLASDHVESGNAKFYLLVEEPGVDTLFKWDFGDAAGTREKNVVFVPAGNLPNINSVKESENLNLAKYKGFMREHTYKSYGLFKVNVIANDSFVTLTASSTVYISRSNCKRPVVKILLANGKKKLTFSIAETFTILTDVNIKCDDSNRAVFTWSLYNSSAGAMKENRLAESDKSIRFPPDVITNQREITIQKRQLSPGIYKVRLLVIMKSLGHSEADEQYLEIVAEPMYVSIEGGSTRLIPWESGATLDGSSSYDPNVSTERKKNLIYKWYCKVKPGSLYFKIGKGGCFGYGDGIVEHNDAIWKIPSDNLIRNAVYIVTLFAESQAMPGRSGSFEQHINVRSGFVMKTNIQCKANCLRKLDPETRLSLVGVCDGCSKFVTYKWTLLLKENLQTVPVKWMQETRTPENSISFVLLPGVLKQSKEYLARFTAMTPSGLRAYIDIHFNHTSRMRYAVVRDGTDWSTDHQSSVPSSSGETGYTDYGIVLSAPPRGGSCTVIPSTGEAVKTPFDISCQNWISDTSSLQYSVSLIKNKMIVGALKDDSESALISYGPLPRTTTKLPEGAKERNFEQKLEIRVIDSYGASTQIIATVKVTPLSVATSGQDASVETELESYVQGKESDLSKLVGSGDVQGLGRFTKAIGKSLDSARKESASPAVSVELKEERKRKREQMRNSLVNSLTEVRVTTLDNFGLIGSALEEVSTSEDELSKESQDKMLRFYESASEFIEGTYSNWGDRDPKLIQDAFGGFVEGLGNMMKSAVLTRSNSSTEGKERDGYLKFTEEALGIIEKSTSMLFRSMVADEIAKRINGDSISVEVKRTEGGRLNSVLMQTSEGGKVQTPSGRGIFGEIGTEEPVIDMKMVSLSKNPYTWDKESIGKLLTPSISNVKFLSNGSTLPVKNLPSGDELVMEIATPNVELVKIAANLSADSTQLIRMKLPVAGASIFLKPRCFGSACRVLIGLGAIPTASSHSDSFDIVDSSNKNDDVQFKIYPDVKSTRFNLVVSSLPRNSSLSNGTVSFTTELFTTGCYYWEHNESKWKSDGCKISSATNPNKTVCICNHLTWFGAGFIVQPHVIDIQSEILKIKHLSDYPALLATVCVITGVYLLAMVWARHQDRKDILKAGLTIVEDCCQTHDHRYDLTIYTGSRPGAGTTSTVCMILGGSNGESDPHCLSNYTDVLFQRGSVDSFLVTSKEDLGKITWLRVWHDNTGEKASWFLSRVLVTDILKGTQTAFICHTWLGIGIEDGKIDKTFICAEGDELKDFETLFLAKTSRGFSDDHLWFSVAMRPPRSHFTRCQRVSCCLSALLCTMLANAIFYQVDTVAGNSIDLGSFSFSWSQIAIGVESALIVIPVNMLIVELFRKAAPSMVYQSKEKEEVPSVSQVGAPSVASLLDDEGKNSLQDVTDAKEETNFVESNSREETRRDPLKCLESKECPLLGTARNETNSILTTANEFTNAQSCVESVVSKPFQNDSDQPVHETSINIEFPSQENDKADQQFIVAKKEKTSAAKDKKTNNSKKANISIPVSMKEQGPCSSTNYASKCPPSPTTVQDKKKCQLSSIPVLTKNKHSKSTALQRSPNASPIERRKERFSPAAQERNNFHSDPVVVEVRDQDLAKMEDTIVEIKESDSLEANLLVRNLSSNEVVNTVEATTPKHHHIISTNVIKDILHHRNKETPQAGNPKKKKETVTFWPHWCFYVGWIVCILTTLIAGFFTLLYGLSFGRVVQEEWLVSFFTSVFQDVFISQPAKVIAVGCIFAFILKKLSEDQQLPEIELAKNNEWVKNNLPLQEKRATDSKIRIPLTDSYVHKAHINRLKEIKLTDVTLEIVVYFFYIFLALLIAYGHRSPAAYGMGQNIKSMFITDKFDQIRDVRDFWNWTDNTFLPSIYGEVWYNGDQTELQGFLADYVTYLIGRPRLRQIRVVPEACQVSELQFDVGRSICGNEFTDSNEDKQDYSQGWIKNGSISDSLKVTENREDPWKYHSDSGLKGQNFASQINTYPGGGYVRTLGKTKAEANTTFAYLKNNLWLDTLTRALFIEFSTYNNNGNFFCIVTLVLEFNPDGGVAPYSKVITTRLDRYNSEFSFFLAACEISFLLFTLYYMWLEFKKFRNKGFAYFRQIGSIVELFSFSVTWAAFALLIVRFGVVKWTKKKYKENADGFTSFQYAASSDLAYGYVFAAVVVIAFLKVLKLFRFNRQMLLLLKTLQRASKDIKYYGIFFGIAFSAFTQVAHLCFGKHLLGYSTQVRSYMSALNLLLGAPQFIDIQKADRVIGPIFFSLFVFIVSFVLVNLFLAMILDCFAAVRKEIAGKPNKYEILEFLYGRLESFLPFLRSIKKANSQLSVIEVEQYYERRLKHRKGLDFESVDTGYLSKRMDQIDDVVSKVILSEWEEIEGFVDLFLETERKKIKEYQSKTS